MYILEMERGREKMESLYRKDKENLMEHMLIGFGCGIFFFPSQGWEKPIMPFLDETSWETVP